MPADLAAEMVARGRRRARCLGEGSRRRTTIPPSSPTSSATLELKRALHRLLRGLCGALRRPARRLRARDEDRGGARRLRGAEGRARAADRRGRVHRRRRRRSSNGPVRDRRASTRCPCASSSEFGFDPQFFRLDLTVHPFAASSGTQDIRLTTRYTRERPDLDLHRDARVRARPLRARDLADARAHAALLRGLARPSTSRRAGSGRTSSAAAGRSGTTSTPQVQAAFPDTLGDVDAGAPSTARSTGCKPTLHPRRRGRGDLQPARDPPFRARAGADRRHDRARRICRRRGTRASRSTSESPIPSDTVGVLQDVHWSGGSFGYFPTYSLGNIVSVQIWEKAQAALPDLPAQFEAGEFGDLHAWLRTNLYALGRKFTPQETLERVVGGPIDAKPYVRYLKEKLGALAAA